MKKIAAGIIINIFLFIGLALLEHTLYFNLVSLKIYDVMMNLRSAPGQDSRIVYVEMDDDAIAALGRWPWPRDIFANIVDTLTSLGARQIIFDVTFAQPASLVIERNAVNNIFKGEDQLKDYIATSIDIAKSATALSPEDVTGTLKQILGGFSQFTSASRQKLDNALLDTDAQLANSFKKGNIFIGYHFDIVTDPADTRKILLINTFRQEYAQRISADIALDFNALPPRLRSHPLIPAKELQASFTRAKIHAKAPLVSINESEATRTFGLPAPKEIPGPLAIGLSAPYDLLTRSVKGGGFINGIPDQDGILRQTPLFIKYKNTLFPHISLSAVMDLYQTKTFSFSSKGYITLVNALVNGHRKNIRIPINNKGEILINWTGRWFDTFQHISIAEIYRLYYLQATGLDRLDEKKQDGLTTKKTTLENLVSGKICFIGLTAAGTHDYNPIPYESAYPMLGTHGNILNSILTEQFLKELPSETEMILLLACAIMIGILLPLLTSVQGLLFLLSFLTACFFSTLLLLNQGIIIHSASLMLLAILSYFSIISYKFATEEKSKRQLRAAFAKYVSSDVIEEIVRDPSCLKLGGNRREMTVLFSDIRHFTSYSEKHSPEEVVTILNEYLDAMTKIIIRHKGTLDKYVGDAIMAIWGAPRVMAPQDSARMAVSAALEMFQALEQLHIKWTNEGKQPLDIGIGINTGDMVVGNMGSELRMDYTVIGDAVNLGARVEALTRQYNARLIVTEATYLYVKDTVNARPLEMIKVKGKENPVMIYAIDGIRPMAMR